MKQENIMPMKLQLFAEGGSNGSDNPQQTGQEGGQSGATSVPAPQIDYDKLAGIISGKQTVTEETVLKSYFKNQGLSGEEMKQAIASFKEQKAKNTPDVAAMQTQLSQAQAQVQQEQIEKHAMLEALALGVDAKTIPYLIKLADLSNVIGDDGKVDQEILKNALNKVLEELPQLKPNTEVNLGFQVGGSSGQNGQSDTQSKPVAATKRWNRFN